MPLTDTKVSQMEAEQYGRPDYAYDEFVPDGVNRERDRFARGFGVIRSQPVWFLGVMVRRAGFMLRHNDSGPHIWPFHSAGVPIVSAEAPVSHWPEIEDGIQSVWSNSPADFNACGITLSPQAEVSTTDNGKELEVRGDNSEYGHQFASGAFSVQRNTDYLLRLPVRLERGEMAASITTPDLRTTLGSETIADAERKERKRSKRIARKNPNESDDADSNDEQALASILVPFASGNRNEARLVLGNNGPQSDGSSLRVGRADLFELGPTPYAWTRYPRALIRSMQKNLFTTNRMLPLEIIGIALLALARRGRSIAVLLVVPIYYLSAQSVFHTEYRYILAIHYFLFVMAAAALFCFGSAFWQGIGRPVFKMRAVRLLHHLLSRSVCARAPQV